MAERILIVDDDHHIVRLIQAYLEQAGYGVLTAYDGETALRLIHTELPDLIVLDLMLPDLDGWSLTRQIRGDVRTARIPILMVTARVEDTDRIVGLEIGADDYVGKPFNPREIVARVRAILRRVNPATGATQLLMAGPLRLDVDQHQVMLGDQFVDLTPTEFDLLRLFLTQPGHAFTRQELIEQGLGYAYEGLERTVDSHVKNVRKKLEAYTDAPQIETVYGVGYRLHVHS